MRAGGELISPQTEFEQRELFAHSIGGRRSMRCETFPTWSSWRSFEVCRVE